MYFGVSYMWSWDCGKYYFFFFINPHSLPLSFIRWSPLSYHSTWFSFVYFSIFFPFLPSLLSFCIVHPSCAKTHYISQISYPYWFCPGLRYNTHAIGTLATKWVQNVWFHLRWHRPSTLPIHLRLPIPETPTTETTSALKWVGVAWGYTLREGAFGFFSGQLSYVQC